MEAVLEKEVQENISSYDAQIRDAHQNLSKNRHSGT
jgi:hypothetical protein